MPKLGLPSSHLMLTLQGKVNDNFISENSYIKDILSHWWWKQEAEKQPG